MIISTERLIIKCAKFGKDCEIWKIYKKENIRSKIGTIQISTGGTYCYIISIHLPINKGYGRESLNALLQKLKNRNFRLFRAYVSICNTRSNKMFCKLGFKNTHKDIAGNYWDLQL